MSEIAQWEDQEDDANELAVDEEDIDMGDIPEDRDVYEGDEETADEAPDAEAEAAQSAVAAPQEEQLPPHVVAMLNQNAAARRIAERDREIMERRFAQLAQALAAQGAGGGQGEPEEEEEPIPDLEENAVAHLAGQTKKLEKILLKDREERQRQDQENMEKAAGKLAADSVFQVRNEVGAEVFDHALNHLKTSLFLEARETNPGMTDQEIHLNLAEAFKDRVKSWAKSGLNVGEQLIKFSAIRGWDPQQVLRQRTPAAPAAPTVPPSNRTQPAGKPKSDAKTEVRNQRAREKHGRTISTVAGAAPQKGFDLAKYAADPNTSEEDWDRTVKMLAEKKGKRKMGFAELLEHKMIPGN